MKLFEVAADPAHRLQDLLPNIGRGIAVGGASRASVAPPRKQGLDLQHLSTPKAQPSSVAQPSIVVQGNVGALQTGAGAVAHVMQHITNSDKDVVLGALRQVLEFLRKDTTSLPEERRNQLVEVAEEAVQEVQKERPNQSKLLGAFSVLAMTIASLADAQPAYQALKGAAAVLGLALP